MLLFWGGWLLAIVTVSSELVQLRQASASESRSGLSSTTVASSLVVFAWWLAYSTRLSVWPGVATDVVTLCLAAAHARTVKLLHTKHVVGIVSLIALVVLLPITALGIIATIGSAVRGLPQLKTAWRAGDLTGVSAPYWTLQALTGLGWLVFGLASDAPWLGAFAVITAPVSLAIAWHATSKKHLQLASA
jgi:uncharacterized protein with PQ loop repeat